MRRRSWPTFPPASWLRSPLVTRRPRSRTAKGRGTDVKLSRLLLVYFPLLAGLLFIALYFAYHPGGVTLNWLGYRVDMHVGAALFLVAVAFLLLQFIGWLLGAILRTPKTFS